MADTVFEGFGRTGARTGRSNLPAGGADVPGPRFSANHGGSGAALVRSALRTYVEGTSSPALTPRQPNTATKLVR